LTDLPSCKPQLPFCTDKFHTFCRSETSHIAKLTTFSAVLFCCSGSL